MAAHTGPGVISISRPGEPHPLLRQNIVHGVEIALPDPDEPVQSTFTVRKLGTMTLLTFGKVAGVEELLRNAVTYSAEGRLVLDGVSFAAMSDIPVAPGALDSVDFILVSDDYDASPQQIARLRRWVTSGGRLILSVAKDVEGYLNSELGKWTGPLFGVSPQSVSVRDLTPLQSYVSGQQAGNKSRCLANGSDAE